MHRIKTGFPAIFWRARSIEAPTPRADANHCHLHAKAAFPLLPVRDSIKLTKTFTDARLLTGKKLTLKVRPGDTVLALKQKIRDTEGIPVAQQRLIFSQQQLADGSRLYDLKIFDGATVHLVLRLARGN